MTYMAMCLTMAALAGATSQAQEEPVRLETTTGALHGTLMMPANARGKVPVALLIAGSGPTDRDGNTPLLPGKNNGLKLIAEALAAQGVATVRYDKRGIGGSVGIGQKSENELTFTLYIDDAIGWLAQLREDARFSTVAVIGHSEGSLIGMMAAQAGRADAFVSLAGAGRPIAVILNEQLAKQLPPALLAQSNRILEELRQGRTVDSIPTGLMMVYRPSIQPYMISWLPLDPAVEIAKLHIPVLIVQGTTDLQAMVTDAETLAAAKKDAKLALIDGMNHVLKEVREESKQKASYSDPTLPLHPGLGKLVGEFILAAKAR